MLERELIAKFRAEGHRLANMTDGGEGAAGRKMSEHTKAVLLKSRSKIVFTEERRRRQAALMTGRYVSPETRELLRQQRLGKPRPAHVIERLASYHRGRPLSAKRRAEAIAQLREVSDRAAAWHRSEEGREWHRAHAIASFAKRQVHEKTCQNCSQPFQTKWEKTKFCCRRCADQVRWIRNRDARLRSNG